MLLIFRLAKEEFLIRKKLLQINKGINLGTHDPLMTVLEKQTGQEKQKNTVKNALGSTRAKSRPKLN